MRRFRTFAQSGVVFLVAAACLGVNCQGEVASMMPAAPADSPPLPADQPLQPPADLPLQDPRPGQPFPFLDFEEWTIYRILFLHKQARIDIALLAELQHIEDTTDPRGPDGLTRRECEARRVFAELTFDAVLDAYQEFEATTGFPTTGEQAFAVLAEAHRELNRRLCGFF